MCDPRDGGTRARPGSLTLLLPPNWLQPHLLCRQRCRAEPVLRNRGNGRALDLAKPQFSHLYEGADTSPSPTDTVLKTLAKKQSTIPGTDFTRCVTLGRSLNVSEPL